MSTLAFEQTTEGVLPKPECEKILIFWCDCVVLGLQGHHNYAQGWDLNWKWILRCVDTLLLNFFAAYCLNISIRQRISTLLNYMSQACLTSVNKMIGKSIFDWILNMVKMLELE